MSATETKHTQGDPVLQWRDGAPPKPWDEEWFIADTTFGRAVLRALPEEWAYDFTTADETYIKADKIKRWMQFPDSNFISPDQAKIAALTAKLESARSHLIASGYCPPSCDGIGDAEINEIDAALALARGGEA